MRKHLGKIKRYIKHFGFARYCPICRGHVRSFSSYGVLQRPDALCPVCYSLERHRLIWLYLQQSNLFDGRQKTMLHVAPESCFKARFQKLPYLRYITTDLMASAVSSHMDLTQMAYLKNSFDIILCSHVLEHIEDDYKAMQELRRVLKRHGWMLIAVPITAERTFEDFTITDPRERERVYGQHDHVRRYGMDIVDRLTSAGIQTQSITAHGLATQGDIKRMRLNPQHTLFICTIGDRHEA